MELPSRQGAMEGHRVPQHSDPRGNTDFLGFGAGLMRKSSPSDPLPPFKLFHPATSKSCPSLLRKGNSRIHTDGI